jgi:hypothetical protein
MRAMTKPIVALLLILFTTAAVAEKLDLSRVFSSPSKGEAGKRRAILGHAPPLEALVSLDGLSGLR